MTLLDKLLSVALGVTIIAACGSLWYADHEHGKIEPLTQKLRDANTAAKQADADRDAALKAAADAQAQLKAASDAVAQANHNAAVAADAASAAHGKLALVSKSPDAAKVLDTSVPAQVWEAINNTTGK